MAQDSARASVVVGSWVVSSGGIVGSLEWADKTSYQVFYTWSGSVHHSESSTRPQFHRPTYCLDYGQTCTRPGMNSSTLIGLTIVVLAQVGLTIYGLAPPPEAAHTELVTRKRSSTTNVLIVCSGNTCRSPIATLFLQDALNRSPESRWDVRSAGYKPLPGQPIWQIARLPLIEVAVDAGIERDYVSRYIWSHQSKTIRETMGISLAGRFVPDTVIVMEHDRVGPVRERLMEVEPDIEPNWVNLNVKDSAYDLWESYGFPDSETASGFRETANAYRQLAAEVHSRATYLSEHPSMLRSTCSPFPIF